MNEIIDPELRPRSIFYESLLDALKTAPLLDKNLQPGAGVRAMIHPASRITGIQALRGNAGEKFVLEWAGKNDRRENDRWENDRREQ